MDLNKPPEELFQQVTDKASFFAFVESLIEDRYEADRLINKNPSLYAPGGWENSTS